MKEEQDWGSFLSICYTLADYVEGIWFLCCASEGDEHFSGYQPQSLKKNPWVLVSKIKAT